jgi:hypothetical protein
MVAINVDSLRQKSGNGVIVRLIDTMGGLCDKKWTINLGLGKTNLPRFILVKYNESIDKYLPNNVKGFPVWDDKTYKELEKLAPAPKDINEQVKTKPEKFIKAMELFNKEKKDYLVFNDFNEAQEKYLEWCKLYCKVDVQKLNAGKKGGDD